MSDTSATTALLVIDMLNPYDHEDADRLAESAERVVGPLHDLIERAREREDVDLVWVNDNYEDYTASPADLIASARAGERPDLIEPIVPPEGEDFLVKVRHSAFYSTSLDHLLRRREIERVILTGQVTEQCILYSALDAYVRGFEIEVPRDCVAHIDPDLGAAALRMMETNMRADVLDGEACLA